MDVGGDPPVPDSVVEEEACSSEFGNVPERSDGALWPDGLGNGCKRRRRRPTTTKAGSSRSRACCGLPVLTTIEPMSAVTDVVSTHERDRMTVEVMKNSLPRPLMFLYFHCLSSFLDGFAAGGGIDSSQASM